jgi:hypothetical protein
VAKLPWKQIYTDFRKRHPNLKKHVTHWCPHDYATILLWMDDGSMFTYNYDTHMVRRIDKKGT